MKKTNGVMMQYFEWYLPENCKLWKQLSKNAAELNKKGFTALWLPPAYKGQAGKSDVGYGVYDLYDLGEFDQKGSVETKYGSRDEYLKAIDDLHANGLQVYADIVLDHMIGADEQEIVEAVQDAEDDRVAEGQSTLPCRHFHGVDGHTVVVQVHGAAVGTGHGQQQRADEVAEVDIEPVAEHAFQVDLLLHDGDGDEAVPGEEFGAGQDDHDEAEREEQSGDDLRDGRVRERVAGGVRDRGTHADEEAGQNAKDQELRGRGLCFLLPDEGIRGDKLRGCLHVLSLL